MDLDPGWLIEKSARIVQDACYALVELKKFEPCDQRKFLQSHLHSIIFNGSKIFCASNAALGGPKKAWSVELVEFLTSRPEECESTLKIISDADYEDPAH